MRKEIEFIFKTRYLNKFKDAFEWTFQPNLDRSAFLSKSNSRTTGEFYERWIHWKENQIKWIQEQQKLKEDKINQEIIENHVETKKYSLRHFLNPSRNANQELTWLTYDGVSEHLKRQYIAQKEK